MSPCVKSHLTLGTNSMDENFLKDHFFKEIFKGNKNEICNIYGPKKDSLQFHFCPSKNQKYISGSHHICHKEAKCGLGPQNVKNHTRDISTVQNRKYNPG